MSEFTLVFNSGIAKLKNPSNVDENFTTRLDRTIQLKRDKKYKVAMIKLQGSYSWYNIEPQRANNLIRYSSDSGATYNDINIAGGIYSYSDINNLLHDAMRNNGDFTLVGGEEVFNINITFNINTFKVTIEITDPTYRFDLVSQAFSNLLGFNVGIISVTSESVRLPDITNSIENIFIHSSLVSNSVVDGVSGNTLFSFSTATLSRSFPFSFEPQHLLWQDLSNNFISEATFKFTDQAEQLIRLNGISVSYTILIKELD